MQITQGFLKGKDILTPDDARLVQARVRKAVFEILKDIIPGSHILDLFAGSGILGIESLSLGAQDVVFTDLQAQTVSILEKNLQKLGLSDRSEVLLGDAFDHIKRLSAIKRPFDLIFVDPPYYKGMVMKSLQYIDEYVIVPPSGFVLGFFFSKDKAESETHEFRLLKQRFIRRYGDTSVVLYERE